MKVNALKKRVSGLRIPRFRQSIMLTEQCCMCNCSVMYGFAIPCTNDKMYNRVHTASASKANSSSRNLPKRIKMMCLITSSSNKIILLFAIINMYNNYILKYNATPFPTRVRVYELLMHCVYRSGSGRTNYNILISSRIH